MKAIDIALKDMTRSFRSLSAVIFMFGVPLLVTGMFYFMFGNMANGGDFNLPKTKVVIANLDAGGPKFQVSTKNVPGGKNASTMGELVVGVLQSQDLADLITVSFAPDAAAARAAVDTQVSQVAIIIPSDFSKQFADEKGKAVIDFYQDPTLTLGPGIMHTILNRFMDGMAGVKIAANVFLDEADPNDYYLTGQVVQEYLKLSLAQSDNLESKLLDVQAPASNTPADDAAAHTSLLLRLISPIMGGMMVFYAFYTGTSTAESILREEEERTLPRLFTTPTPQAIILTGKFLAVFLTVLMQVIVLILVSHLIFGIRWGDSLPLALTAAGIVFSASAFGIFVNSFLTNTKQGGVVFGGVLTLTGMLGMISIFAQGSPSAATLGNTVALLVPQGWAVRGLVQTMNGEPLTSVLLSALALLAWGAAFFVIGVSRFNRRYL